MSEADEHVAEEEKMESQVVPRDERGELTAAEVLERLGRGELVENVTVRNLKFRGEFTQPVRFKGCTLVRVNFDGATFKDNLQFRDCHLEKVNFNRKTVCEQLFDLGQSTLSKTLIRSLTVKGKVNVANTRFRGKLMFQHCRFEGDFLSWEGCYEGWVDFRKCEFLGEADLRSSHFTEGLVFSQGCKFHKPLLMRGATVQKKFDVGNSHFEVKLDLAKAKLHDFVYLEGMTTGGGFRFAIWNALAERVRVQPEQLKGRIESEENRDYATAMQEYGVLKRSYQNLHLFDQEDWAFYRFKVNQRRGCGRSWARPWTKLLQFCDWLLLDIGCAYGTNPMRAVWAGGVIILLFAAIYGAGYTMFPERTMPFDSLTEDHFANRMMYGLLTSASVFTSGLSGLRDVAKGWMNVPLLIESVVGILLFGLFIVAFSRKVIR